MDDRINPSLAEQSTKRRGRPRKSLPDAGSVEAVSDVSTERSGHGQVADGSEPGTVFDAWRAVTDLAWEVAETGLIVTQLHTTGEGKRWQYLDLGAATHSHSDGDYVITSDGAKHTLKVSGDHPPFSEPSDTPQPALVT